MAMAKSLHQRSEPLIPQLYIFVEELSAKRVLDVVIPKIIPQNVSFQVYPHQGKEDLERAINTTVPSISRIPGARILIARDQDSGDCKRVKQRIKSIIQGKSSAPTLIRIVCRELEAWYLGDLNAVSQAYPRVKPQHYLNKADFRNVDLIQNADELLLSIIPEYNNINTLPKLEVAENVSPFLDVKNNSSTSFQNFVSGVDKLLAMSW
jgi:hypothetical protein